MIILILKINYFKKKKKILKFLNMEKIKNKIFLLNKIYRNNFFLIF